MAVRSAISPCSGGSVAKLYPTLVIPRAVAHQPPIHGTFQARMLEWEAISFSRESSQPRDQTQVSCIRGRFFTY